MSPPVGDDLLYRQTASGTGRSGAKDLRNGVGVAIQSAPACLEERGDQVGVLTQPANCQSSISLSVVRVAYPSLTRARSIVGSSPIKERASQSRASGSPAFACSTVFQQNSRPVFSETRSVKLARPAVHATSGFQ